jgi:hypothetical protein
MAFAEVGSGSQRASGNNSGAVGPLSIAFPGNVTSGNLLIGVVVWWRSAGASATLAVDDTRSTTWNTIVSDAISLGTGTYRLAIVWGVAASSGANTIDFADSGGSAYMSASVNEFSGQHASPLSVSTTTPNTGTSVDPVGTLTTLNAGELVIGIAGHGDGAAPTLAVDAPSTQFGEKETDNLDMAHSAAYRVGGAAGSHAINWTVGSSVVWSTLVASFKAADGGGGGGSSIAAIVHHYQQQGIQ